MTWAERVGDLATNIALVAINLARIFSLLAQTLFEYLDELVTSLEERSEDGLRSSGTPRTAWARLPSSVFGAPPR